MNTIFPPVSDFTLDVGLELKGSDTAIGIGLKKTVISEGSYIHYDASNMTQDLINTDFNVTTGTTPPAFTVDAARKVISLPRSPAYQFRWSTTQYNYSNYTFQFDYTHLTGDSLESYLQFGQPVSPSGNQYWNMCFKRNGGSTIYYTNNAHNVFITAASLTFPVGVTKTVKVVKNGTLMSWYVKALSDTNFTLVGTGTITAGMWQTFGRWGYGNITVSSGEISNISISDNLQVIAYLNTSPVATQQTWTGLGNATISSVSIASGVFKPVTEALGIVKFQVALDNGVWNGTWLTLSALNILISGHVVTDYQKSIKIKVQFLSDAYTYADIVPLSIAYTNNSTDNIQYIFETIVQTVPADPAVVERIVYVPTVEYVTETIVQTVPADPAVIERIVEVPTVQTVIEYVDRTIYQEVLITPSSYQSGPVDAPALLFNTYAANVTATAAGDTATHTAQNVIRMTEEGFWNAGVGGSSRTVTITSPIAITADAIAVHGRNIDNVVITISSGNQLSSNTNTIGNCFFDTFTQKIATTYVITLTGLAYNAIIYSIVIGEAKSLPYFEDGTYDPDNMSSTGTILQSTNGLYLGANTQKAMREFSLSFGQVTEQEYVPIHELATRCIKKSMPFIFIPDRSKHKAFWSWVKQGSKFSAPLKNGLRNVGKINIETII